MLLCPGLVQVDGLIDGAHLPKPFSNSVMRFETARKNRRAGGQARRDLAP
jgi:hypothetical protein